MEDKNIIKCSICGQDTSFERSDPRLPMEGEKTTCCDKWVCADCICWTVTDEKQTICMDHCNCHEDDDYGRSSTSSSTISYCNLSAYDFFEYDDTKKYWPIVNECLCAAILCGLCGYIIWKLF